MKTTRHLISSLLVAGSLAAAVPLTFAAADAAQPGPMAGKQCPHKGMDHDGMGQHGKGRHEDGMGMAGHGLKPRFLHGLDLTAEQKDKVFAILHPLMPAEREHHKSIQNLREQQRALTLSANYDAGKLKKLVDAEAKEHSQHQLQMAEAQHKIFQLLSAEQQTRLAERQQSRTQ